MFAERELALLVAGAASLGLLHTLLGPDHYLPFVLLGRTRGWSLARTLRLTLACGAGHVAASLALGAGGVAVGMALGRLDALQQARGTLAAWLLIGFGLAYAAWGVRQALRDRPHAHWHAHPDGSVHSHPHVHRGEHAHPHLAKADGSERPGYGRWAGWTLFTVFVVGPCEPLVPLLMVPGSRGSWLAAGLVVATFAATTLGAMAAIVAAGQLGLARLASPGRGRARRLLAPLERFGHAAAGVVLAACGVAMWAGL